MGLLVDTSGSVGSRFEFEQTAATAFMQHTLRKGYDRAFVIGFNTHSQVAQEFTDNVTLLSLVCTGCETAAELPSMTRFIAPVRRSS